MLSFRFFKSIFRTPTSCEMAAIIKVQFPSDTSFAKLAELSRNPNAAVPDDAIPALDEQGDLMDATMRHRRVQEHAQSIYGMAGGVLFVGCRWC